VAIIIGMSDEKKPKPLDDLKEGLGLLFRAAKGAVESLPTEKVEDVAKDAAKEVGRAFETLGHELDKAFNKATGSAPPPPAPPAPPAEAKKDEPPAPPPEQKFDDAYAPEPEPPKGPRVG
jgi:hypothetical protein